eukprot:TRINITY_DN189_c7_g1_i1.p1 TRINITY_DN189_c7_g1~~TRINITY_DN189_c7_g1_i1.p1  ORF type:complete len:311 (+),score=36.43 TRINITY_DN189_c7_g1_i1:56-934(+)
MSSRTTGHIARQAFLAFFLMMFAIMNTAVFQHQFYDIGIDDIKTGARLAFGGSIVVAVMSVVLVGFGFVSRTTGVVKLVGLALMACCFLGTILWIAGLGKLIDALDLESVAKTGAVGELIGSFFFSVSFLLLCLKDYISGGDYENVDGSTRATDQIFRQMFHLLGLILFLTLAIGVPFGDNLDYQIDDIKTAARLCVAGVVIVLVICASLAAIPFVIPPSSNGMVKTIGLLQMVLVFVGSIVIIAGVGKIMDFNWDFYSKEDKVKFVGIVFGVFGFTNAFILYSLPDYGYLI